MSKMGTGFKHLVSEAQKEVKEVTAEDIKQRLGRKEAFHLIDVREAKEWQMAHLPTSTNIPRGVIEMKIETEIPSTDAPIVLYCGSGGRSSLVARNLQKMGYQNIESLAGGLIGWKSLGFDVVSQKEAEPATV